MEPVDTKPTEHEYETQFFGFTPESFVDGVYNAVNDYVVDCFQELENLLKSELIKIMNMAVAGPCETEPYNDDSPLLSSAVTEEQLQAESDKMANNFYRSIDVAFDRFEVYVKNNIFKIPANILLPEDKVHCNHQYTEEDEKQVDKELEELEKKIKAAKYVNSALKQEIKDLDNAQEKLDNFEKHIDTADKAFGGTGGIKQSLELMHEEATKLHHLLADGLNTGAFLVQKPPVKRSSTTTSKQKKIKLTKDEPKLD